MFSLIISQLRGLSSVTANQAETQGMNHPVLYLLHNIATVRFFTSDANLMTDLDIKNLRNEYRGGSEYDQDVT